MNDVSRTGDQDVVNFRYKLPHLEDGADNHLHTSEWATGCVAEALSDAIERAVKPKDYVRLRIRLDR